MEAWDTVPLQQRGGVDMVRELIKRIPLTVTGTVDATFRELMEEGGVCGYEMETNEPPVVVLEFHTRNVFEIKTDNSSQIDS